MQKLSKLFETKPRCLFPSMEWMIWKGDGRLEKAFQHGTFEWNFAIVDQHKAATTKIDFHEWAKAFGASLMKIGQVVLVLTPGEKPIAISRSWCCFEWTTIVQSNIPLSYCVPIEDEETLIERMHNGMSCANFNTLFAGINVEEAEAFKETDEH